MIEPLIERRPGNGDAEFGEAGEIRKAEATWRMFLAEDHLLLRAFDRAPRTNPSLQRATYLAAELRMSAAQLLQNGDRPQMGRGFQQRHNVRIPDVNQGIWPASAAPR